MNLTEQEIDFLEQQIPEMAKAAVSLAFWQALASGESVLVSEKGFIKEVFPDGTLKIIRETEPFTKVEKGSIIQIK